MGGAPAMQALLGGEVQVNFGTSSTALPHIRAGKLRALAVTGAKRSQAAPELPTIGEAGVKGYQHSSWVGLLAPAKTPPEIIARVNEAMKRVLAEPATITRIEGVGGEVLGNSPEDTARMLREELERWERLVKERGLKFQ